MASIQSKVYHFLLRIMGVKSFVVKEFKKNDFSKRANAAAPPGDMFSRYDIQQDIAPNGRKVWSIQKRDTQPQRAILYLHGGAYIHNLVKQHWQFLDQLLLHTPYTTIIVPDYPLAPDHTYQDAFDMVVPIYKKLRQNSNITRVTLLGDSAGGGFSLALAQYALNAQLPQPDQLVLLSPWLDVALENPAIRDIDPLDPYLSVAGLQLAGKAYAGQKGTQHYLVSPINGPLAGLAPISLFIGTYDILVADARKFRILATAAGIPLRYVEYPEMVHVFLSLKVPEAKQAAKQIFAVLQEK
ncbi:alpha/beta hydrolase fold domain-containing protein [Chitinophaga nivalis]|uniref:Alpha/beta hydrolase n=1 Tax=Chitinophaga nivalis TaxID=2991709 RepID=A0ABT3IH39_9BACT|nr:alpha/beta hydrolase [Chitinophaga nivalis]MCW3467043.1 alpha/beta hydrolase [Chitinophaga nivalis]MCW3483266.1 alpha/beta hydrolase [Chitinophaga nivalis]